MAQYYDIQKQKNLIDSKASLSQYIKNLLLDEYKIYEISQKKGELIPYHAHSYHELIIVLEGKLRLIIEEDIIDLTEGDFLTIEPWAIHLLSFPEKNAKFYLCFHPKKKNKQI
ncbi:MAG: cupin domain-containing protein [Spirochaetia bacterium]|nr:cupin domain-containing protein [Spirochaetia bacterium]